MQPNPPTYCDKIECWPFFFLLTCTTNIVDVGMIPGKKYDEVAGIPPKTVIDRALAVVGDWLDTWCRASYRRQLKVGSDDSKNNRAGATGSKFLQDNIAATNSRHGADTYTHTKTNEETCFTGEDDRNCVHTAKELGAKFRSDPAASCEFGREGEMRATLFQRTGDKPTHEDIEREMHLEDVQGAYVALAATSDQARAQVGQNVRVRFKGVSSLAFFALHDAFDSGAAVNEALTERREQGSVNEPGLFIWSKAMAGFIKHGAVIELGTSLEETIDNILAFVLVAGAVMDGRAPFKGAAKRLIRDRLTVDDNGWATVTFNGNELHFETTTAPASALPELPQVKELEEALRVHSETKALKKLFADPTICGLEAGADEAAVFKALEYQDIKAQTAVNENWALKTLVADPTICGLGADADKAAVVKALKDQDIKAKTAVDGVNDEARCMKQLVADPTMLYGLGKDATPQEVAKAIKDTGLTAVYLCGVDWQELVAMMVKLNEYMDANYIVTADPGDTKKRASRTDILSGALDDTSGKVPKHFMNAMKRLGYKWNRDLRLNRIKGVFVGLEPK